MAARRPLSAASIPAIVLLVIVAAAVLVFLVLLGMSMCVDSSRVRPVPAVAPAATLAADAADAADAPDAPDAAVSPPPRGTTLFRLRCLNTHCLPWLRPRAHPDLYTGVDGAVFQELFRTPSLLCSDALAVVARPGVQLASVTAPQRRGKVIDSGLAAAAVAPWRVASVASSPLPGGENFDAFADKRVAVFAFTHGAARITVATTHLQAFYEAKAGARNQKLRASQFQHALDFAYAHGADVLAGDINTPEPELLAQFDEWVHARGGYRPAHDAQPTSQHPIKYFESWRANPSSWGSKLDFVWVLRPQHVQPATFVTTNYAVALTWTDHAAIDVAFYVNTNDA